MLAVALKEQDSWSETELRHWLRSWDYARIMQRGANLAIPVAERFDWRGNCVNPGFHRIRVLARQTYVLCHAAIGGHPEARALASLAMSALLSHGVGEDGQFYSRICPEGMVVDGTADLYDIAFGLFALAWWYRLSGDEGALDAAERSIANIREKMRSRSGRGFVARAGERGPHQQNPHMHLFEAAIFLAAFSARPAFRDLADELFELVDDVMFDPASCSLSEFFDDDWRPSGPTPGAPVRVEPGHHYEWVWLLARYGDLANQPKAHDIADRLFVFATLHGHDHTTGLVLDAVTPAGRPLARDYRLWPNTELLKAQVAMCERLGSGLGFRDIDIAQNLARIRRHFLTRQVAGPAAQLAEGFWIDYLKRDGVTPKSDHVPASTLYHIMFGFTEVLRHQAGRHPFDGRPW